MTENPTRHEVVDRRDALKALAAATGAVTLASLPTRWSKPTLSVGAIPAHAQSSCFDLIIDFAVSGAELAAWTALPPADEGGGNTFGESGTWVWYCGLESLCITLFLGAGVGSIDWTVTSRDGTVLVGSGVFEFFFNAATGSISPSACF